MDENHCSQMTDCTVVFAFLVFVLICECVKMRRVISCCKFSEIGPRLVPYQVQKILLSLPKTETLTS